MTLHLLLDGRRPLLYTAAWDEPGCYLRYGEPEGTMTHGRELAYRRGLTLLAVDADALLSVADARAVDLVGSAAGPDPS